MAMSILKSVFLLFSVFSCSNTLLQGENSNPVDLGIWSRSGRLITIGGTTHLPTSEFGSEVSISSNGDGVLLKIGSNIMKVNGIEGPPNISEVLINKDGRYFSISESDGGWVGTWNSTIFHVASDKKVDEISMREIINNYSTNFARCDDSEDLNIGVLAWINEGRDVLLAAEVPPHSSCSNMGEIRGFLYSIKEKRIVRNISETELKSKWNKYLGKRLLQ